MANIKAPKSLGRQLNFAAGAANALAADRLAPHDLTLAQWVILSTIWRGATPTINELASVSGNKAPAVSRIVDRMVDGGLLTRVADPHDRRTVRIGATEKGAALSHLVNFHDDITATLTKGFTTAEIDTLFALLARIENNARDIPDPLA